MEVSEPVTTKCPFCAEVILAEAIKCKHCGEMFGRPVGKLNEDFVRASVQSTVRSAGPPSAVPAKTPPATPTPQADPADAARAAAWTAIWEAEKRGEVGEREPIAQHASEPATPPAVKVSISAFSNAQPVWHYVILSIATLGLYDLVWFFKNWNLTRSAGISKGSGIVAAILHGIAASRLFPRLNQLAEERGFVARAHPLALALLYTGSWLIEYVDPLERFLHISGAETTMLAICITARIASVAQMVPAVNQYWAVEQPGLQMRQKFLLSEWIALVLGSAVLALALVGTLMPESPHS